MWQHLLEQLGGVGDKLPAEAADVAAVLAQLLLHLSPPLLDDRQRCLCLHVLQCLNINSGLQGNRRCSFV